MKKITMWLKKYFIPHDENGHKPHFLRHESMLFFFLLIIVMELGFLVQVFVVFDKTKFLASVLPAVLTSITNEERAENDVPPLTENELLNKAAQAKAEDMAKNGYFAHTSPEGKTPWYWFSQVGYKYTYAGENLAVNFFESGEVAQAWMNSPTHRANIVKKNYTEIGIGVANGTYQGKSTVFVAQLFGTPLASAAVKDELPTPPTNTKQASVKVPPKTAPVKPVVTLATPPTVTPPVVATEPISVEVLGEEMQSPTITPVTVSKLSQVKAFFEKALSSPRESVGYMYKIIGMLIMFTLAIFFVRSEIQHPRIIARGFAMIFVIIALSVFNFSIINNTETVVPTDNHNMTASVIQALP